MLETQVMPGVSVKLILIVLAFAGLVGFFSKALPPPPCTVLPGLCYEVAGLNK